MCLLSRSLKQVSFPNTHKLFLRITPITTTLSKQLNNICVLSRFYNGEYKEFVMAAIDHGQVLAKKNNTLSLWRRWPRVIKVFFKKAACTKERQVIGIIGKALKPLGCLSSFLTRKKLVISSMQERITEMLCHADAFIFFLEDLITLEALITFAFWTPLNIHQKPLVC